MGDADSQRELRKVEEWLLAILRFAVTGEQTDRAAILATAANMDRPRAPAVRSDFAFFVRTSSEICDLIVGENSPANKAALRHHLGKIPNERLRRALAAALEIEPFGRRIGRARSQRDDDLWRGLPIRH